MKLFKTPIFIFITFVFLASAITGASLWYSNTPKTKFSDAASFGIQPPYIHFDKLTPGDTAETSIRVMRGDTSTSQKVIARFDELAIADWIIISPDETLIINPGEKYATFVFKIKVPSDAYNEDYKGSLYFAISSPAQASGVGIALGARADVDIRIVGGRDGVGAETKGTSEASLANNSLVERLQGFFIMRADSHGELYYLHPQERKIYSLNSVDDFSYLVKNNGRDISNDLLFKIPMDLKFLSRPDSDGDGLPDTWELAIGTDSNKVDSDADNFSDLVELRDNFSPFKKDTMIEYDKALTNSLTGFILIQSEKNKQVWYVDPKIEKRVLVDDTNNFSSVIKKHALGISESNFQKLFK